MLHRLSSTKTGLIGFALASVAAAVLNGGAQPSPLSELTSGALARIDGEVSVKGLQADVRVVRDTWGVPHIYANSDVDLFFAQGYVAAQDRLWQMEMWRRSAEGRLAEVLGQQAVGRDRMARLLKYRGRFDAEEFESYHPDAKRLMTAFVAGVNAFIASNGEHLPVEFVLTGIKPEPWTVEALLLRQVTFGDATSELQLARQVASLGAAAANRRRNPDPWDDLAVPNGLDVASIGENVLASTRSGGRGMPRPEILPAHRGLFSAPQREHDAHAAMAEDHVREPGSNNWVVSGAMSATGKPVVANDPHREVGNPSLRYIFHLNAPGWNVIGASEAPFVGIGLGHNERVAWGLTIVGTDQHDVYVEDVNPANPNEVRWQGSWEPLRIVREEIAIKERMRGAQAVELKFSRHGPDLLRGSREKPGVRSPIGAARAGHGAVSRRPAPEPGEELPRVPGRRDVLEVSVREPDLRRRGRQHLLAGVGADAESTGMGRTAAGSRHWCLRVAGVPKGPSSRIQSRARLYCHGESQRAAEGRTRRRSCSRTRTRGSIGSRVWSR